MGSNAVDLRILGALEMTVHGETVAVPARVERAILASLAIRVGRPIPADLLAEDVWGGHPPPTWRKGVHVGVSRLRRRLESVHADAAAVVVTATNGYALDLDPAHLDAVRLERAAESGRRLLAEGRADEAHAVLSDGLALWRGHPLQEIAESPSARAEIARLHEVRASLIDRYHEATLEQGDVDTVIGRLEASLVEDPLRERRWTLLMLALYRAGRQNDALRAFQRARTVLADELGLEPGPELRQMEAAILAHDPALSGSTRQRVMAAARHDRRSGDRAEGVHGAARADGADGAHGAASSDAAPGTRAAAPHHPTGPDHRTGEPVAHVPLTPRPGRFNDPIEWARNHRRIPLVGRDEELARLLSSWRRVIDGHQGGLVVLTGDTQVGKTRLAGEVALAAEADGALVLAGRCVPGMGLSSFVGQVTALDLAAPDAHLGPGSPVAFEFAVDVATRIYGEAGAGRPVLAILEDAHAADLEIINLFRHLAERPLPDQNAIPAMAIVVSRSGVPSPPGMAAWLAEAERLPVTDRVEVPALDPAAAVGLLRDRLGPDGASRADDELRVLGEQAGRRPGYLIEIARQARASGLAADTTAPLTLEVLGVPDVLRSLVTDHLDAQPDEVVRVLLASAVAGRRFELDMAARATAMGEDDALDALERAVAARLLYEVDGAPGSYGFVTEVERLVLLDRVTNTRRAVVESRLAG